MKKSLSIILCIFSSVFFYAQEVLSNINTAWTTVITGSVVYEPAITSYGFCLINDARELQAFTEDGKLLWEKNIPKARNPIISSLPDDFLVIFSEDRSRITLLNPSGSEIWNRKLSFHAEHKTFAGRDGRFFVYGENNIECYGMNGICKWTINTEKNISQIDLQELPDGSFVVFLEGTVDGKSQGIRISPFGTMLEEITFAGQVLSSCYCDSGICLTFSDGNAGFFSLSENNKIQNKWVLAKYASVKKNEAQIKSAFFIVSENKKNVIYVYPEKNSVEINRINPKNGDVISSFKAENLLGFEIAKTDYKDGLFLADRKNAIIMNESGKEIWTARMPEKTFLDWNYLLLTNNNTFIFCSKNWSLAAYSTVHPSSKIYEFNRKYDDFIPDPDTSYYLYINEIPSSLVNVSRIQNLRKGYYGENEIQWCSDLNDSLEAYILNLSSENFGTRIENSVFDEDTQGVNQLFMQIMLLGTTDYAKYTSKFLRKINNSSYLLTLLTGVSENGFDPDGEILKSLEYLSSRINPKNETTIMRICDATYSICKFMGRPAFNSKGKAILANFLYPKYDNKTRIYARNVLTKIKDLDL